MAGCTATRPDLPREVQDVLPEGERRPLEVVFAAPQGRADELPQAVTVGFNQPMTPLKPVPVEEATGPLTLEPAVPGKYRWKGTATLVFEPEKPLPFGTEFKATVPKGTSSWADQELKEDYTFTFETPGPKLTSSQPENNAKWLAPDTSVKLFFNQPIPLDKAAEFIVLAAANPKTGKLERRSFTLEHPTAEDLKDSEDPPAPETIVVVRPDEPLPVGRSFQLKVQKGLPGQGGPLGMASQQFLSFSTYNEFQVTTTGFVQQRPGESVDFNFTNPVAINELAKALTIEPAVELPESYTQDDYTWDDLYLYLPLEPRTTYTMTLSPELKDKFGNALGKPFTLKVKTLDRAPHVTMAEGLGILEAQGPRSIPVGLLNIDQYQVQLARISPEQVIKLLDADNWSYGKLYTPPGGFQSTETVKPKLTTNRAVDRPVDVGKVLKGRNGFVYYRVSAKQGEAHWDHRGLAQVTNLGISAKFSPENMVVLVSSLDKAEPVEAATVEVRDKSGKVLWTGKTGKEGTVQPPGWAGLGLALEQGKYYSDLPSLWVFVTKGDDTAFVRSDGFGGISPWQFDVPFTWDQKARDFDGHAFSERGLYRPGEEVYLKGTLRERRAGSWILPELKEIVFRVYDSRDKELGRGTLAISDFGSFDQKLDLASDAPTGTYRVEYSLPEPLAKKLDEEGTLFSHAFRVEAFRPAQFEVTVDSSQKSLVAGDQADFTVKGWYLFGAPMAGEAVTWTARIEPYSLPVDEEFEGYDFGPGYYDEETTDEPTKLASGEGELDTEGLIKGQVKLEGITYKGSALLTLEGTVTSPTRQQLSGRTQVPVHRGDFSIGLRPKSTFVPSKQEVPVEVVALNTGGDTIQGEDLTLQLVRREWNSVRKADVGGAYRWITETVDEVLEEKKLQSAVNPTTVSLTPPGPGFYLVRANGTDDRGNPITTITSFYAYGAGYVPWARGDDDVIELVSDKKRYAPGDTARILVKSPYEKAKALVTVERELILERYVVDIEGSADTVEIPIRSKHLPNVYVSVMLLQGRLPDAGFSDAGEDLGKPSFKIGYVNLPVESGEKRLKVEVGTDRQEYRPGDEVKATLKVLDHEGKPVKAEVSLSVADQGVLGLIGYQTPEYFDTFYGPRPLSVRTSETRLDVIGQRSYGTKGEDGGGGGGFQADYREDFKFTAYWNPAIETDENGEAVVTFTLPENLTTFKLMATAQTKASQFGSGDNKLVVNKELLLKPSTPQFVRLGDSFEAGVLAFNNGDDPVGVTIEVAAEGVEAPGHTRSTVAIEPGEEHEILFSFKATKEGQATLAFQAVVGGAGRDGLKITFPIELPRATEAVATSGDATEARSREAIEIPAKVVPGTTQLAITAASTALAGLDSSVISLLRYPYGCLEQRLSRVVPILLAERLVAAYDLEGFPEDELKPKVQETLNDLSSFRVPGGGFALWAGSDHPNDYVTAYALVTAAQAKKRGYTVDQETIDHGRAYLKTLLNRAPSERFAYSDKEKLTLRAFALYALTLWDFKDSSYASVLFRERDKLSLDGKAWLLQAARRLKGQEQVVSTLEKELAGSLVVEAQTAHFPAQDLPWLFGSAVRTTGVVLSTLLEGQKGFEPAPRVVRWLMEARNRDGSWDSTQDNVAALSALIAYYDRYEKTEPDFDVTVLLGQENVLEHSFRGRDTQVQRDTVPVEGEAGKTLDLTFEKEGEGRLYYGARLTYAPAEPMPPRDEGMAVFKLYTRVKDGKRATDFRAGETYKVTLSVVTPAQRRFVVLEDPVPAGMEVVQTTFETESDSMRDLLKSGGANPWWSFNHFETYDNRVLLFADSLGGGEHTYEYLVRARLPGTYSLPATKVEEMYHPEVFGTTSVQKVTVR